MPIPLLIARHGQTDLNIDDRWQGRLDPPLNATGQAQAQALAQDVLRALRTPAAPGAPGILSVPAGVLHILSSPQLRARQTAAPLAEALGLPVATDERLRERDFGVFDGLTPAESDRRLNGASASALIYQWDAPLPDGQGETTHAVVQRVAAFLAELRERCDGQTVVLVCHGFVIRCLRHLLDDIPREDFFATPRLGNGQWLLRQL